MMRTALIAVLATATACGGKKAVSPEAKAAVDRYANVDMPLRWAQLWTGIRPFKKLQVDLFETGHEEWLEMSMTDVVIPRLTEFLDGAAKVTPPAPLTASHALIVEVATEYRAIGKDMLAAAQGKDPAKFKVAFERQLPLLDRYNEWQRAFDKALTDHGVTFKDVPPLPEPEPEPTKPTKPDVPKAPVYCGDAPCPCAEGGDKPTTCTLTAATTIDSYTCAPGKAVFRDDGSLASCMFADTDYYLAGEATFHPNGKLASARSNVLAATHGVLCGAGPARWFATGDYEACTLTTGSAEQTIAGLTVPPRTKDAYIVLHPDGAPRYVKHADQERCLDLAGKPVEPCTAPTW
jgi:hypothetical protein